MAVPIRGAASVMKKFDTTVVLLLVPLLELWVWLDITVVPFLELHVWWNNVRVPRECMYAYVCEMYVYVKACCVFSIPTSGCSCVFE